MDIASNRQFATPIVLIVATLLGVQIFFTSVVRAENEVLEHTLTLRQDQSGFAGVSVKVIAIEPNGDWLEEHYLISNPGKSLKEQRRTKHNSGTLSESDVEGLKSRLESAQLETLESGQVKESLGSSESQITISYGPHVVARSSLSFDNKSGAMVDQLMELAKSIEESISKQTD